IRSFTNMSKLVIVLLLLNSVAIVFAQQPTKQTTDPTTNPRKQKIEKNDALLRWPDEDVPYIITDAERRAFKALKTNDERENFIKTFWDNRDPNPDTEANEYREEYYERIAYANEHFSSGIPGWKT